MKEKQHSLKCKLTHRIHSMLTRTSSWFSISHTQFFMLLQITPLFTPPNIHSMLSFLIPRKQGHFLGIQEVHLLSCNTCPLEWYPPQPSPQDLCGSQLYNIMDINKNFVVLSALGIEQLWITFYFRLILFFWLLMFSFTCIISFIRKSPGSPNWNKLINIPETENPKRILKTAIFILFHIIYWQPIQLFILFRILLGTFCLFLIQTRSI